MESSTGQGPSHSAPANDAYPEDHFEDPAIVIEGDDLILENGAPMPADGCVKCARPATHTIDKKLRNPRNPLTWFGKRYHLQIGLCKKHRENYLIAQALTWSVLGLGAILLVVGIATLHWISILVGLLLLAVSGVFRALVPVWSDSVEARRVVIRGCGEPYLDELRKYGDPD